MSAPSILPDSRLTTVMTPQKSVWRTSAWWQPIFCASCGKDGGLVPEENVHFAFYLCNDCSEKHGNIEGTFTEPDNVFYERVRQEQIQKYGRSLTAEETIISLANPDSQENKLARDRKHLTPSTTR